MDCILSSTAAPFYFKPYLNRYVDGGVTGLNDPILCGIAEITK